MQIIYTDGGCRGNNANIDNIGAEAFVHYNQNKDILYEYRKAHFNVTNNQMELLAIQHAMEYAVSSNFSSVTIYSDSNYAVKSINEYSLKWMQNDWLTAKKEAVKNQDIIKPILSYRSKIINFTLLWVKGHGSNACNIYVDKLVNIAMDEQVTHIEA